MAGAINVALKPNAGPRAHAVLPSIPLRSRKNAVPHFPHQAGHHPHRSRMDVSICVKNLITRRLRQQVIHGVGLLGWGV
jgi:hypothetical protein